MIGCVLERKELVDCLEVFSPNASTSVLKKLYTNVENVSFPRIREVCGVLGVNDKGERLACGYGTG